MVFGSKWFLVRVCFGGVKFVGGKALLIQGSEGLRPIR